MSVITLFKAQVTVDAIPDLEVRAVQSMESLAKSGRASLDEPFREFETRNRAFFDDEAKKLADALYASLPGGTIDALLVQLLDRKRSIYYVRHDEPNPPHEAIELAPLEQHLDRAKRIVIGSLVDVHRFESAEGPSGPVDFHGTVKWIGDLGAEFARHDDRPVFLENDHGGACRTSLSHCKLSEKEPPR